jgi:hypothetical protein
LLKDVEWSDDFDGDLVNNDKISNVRTHLTLHVLHTTPVPITAHSPHHHYPTIYAATRSVTHAYPAHDDTLRLV